MDHRKEAFIGGVAILGLAAYEGFRITDAQRRRDEHREETIIDLESVGSGDGGFEETAEESEVIVHERRVSPPMAAPPYILL